jgi:hypothetical protein
MNNKHKDLLLITTSWLILFYTCISQNNNPDIKEGNGNSNFEVIFPMNDYLTTNNTTPYPILVQDKLNHINTSSFINVMDYGAAGNGIKADDDAIAKAFAACKDNSGVIFPKGAIFLIQNLTRIPLNKNITIYAYGATFKMASSTGYNAIAFEGNSNGYNNQVVWLGGLFDGNKNSQSWPGSPTGNNSWTVTQPNYGLLTIRHARFALVKDISLINTVYDGVNLYECELGVIADSKAEDGVNLNYFRVRNNYSQGHQSTYFKCTRRNSQVIYFMNLDCKDGSIGVQYSTNTVSDSSLAVVNNCHFYNQGQDAMHFESCRRVFIYQCTVGADNSRDYEANIHISNSCIVASIKKSKFYNGRVSFMKASNLQLGIVEDCQFESYALHKEDSTLLRNFIQKATFVKDCTFRGRTKEEGVTAKYITGSSFQLFDIAVNGTTLVDRSSFKNGTTSIESSRSLFYVNDCEFINTSNPSSTKGRLNGSMVTKKTVNDVLSKSISAFDQRKKFLGYITKTT